MVNPGLTIKLFDFQEQAVLKLLDLTAKQTSKQTVVMKAPTGSGKTIILIDYVPAKEIWKNRVGIKCKKLRHTVLHRICLILC